MRARELISRLFDPVDIASLVLFRIMFGAIMLWEVWRYFDHGWIRRYYIEPVFHFKYYGFGWVKAWPGDGMYWHFVAMGLLAAFILSGFLYRLSTALFFLAFTYVYLLDQARYLNHFYLVSLISFLMIFVPAHRALSIDAWLRPGIRRDITPAWSIWILRAQM
ncbi:MAG: HTTM domain-containing protein, partial [Planctomycetota bacterium]